VFFLLFTGFAFAQSTTGVPAIDTLKRHDWDIETNRGSLGATIGLALIFPGGGQFYTKHYVRGGFLFAFEGALIYETFFNKFRQNRLFNKNIRDYRDSVSFCQNRLDSSVGLSDSSYWQARKKIYDRILLKEESKKMASKDLWTSEFTWLAGLHIYGLFDAYGIWKNNNLGHSTETHSALSALWRAALIPGWGQIYNNEYGKAGMLYMGLLGSAVSYWSRQKMVEYHLDNLRQARAEMDSQTISAANEDVLFYRKKRNQYVWAMALFYIYSMADAAVDAMLHDFDSPVYFVMQPMFSKGLSAEAGFYF
ncbi:MAG: DUF5683 domain-containing protein, partial [Candidatus Fibromonas sp.]|jgi:hypothetical protein|nr:DUF5683 domain-containing protein [Candidatus Fibromonas sp.]